MLTTEVAQAHQRALAFADYQAIDARNWSTVKYMDVSPKHYRHAIAQPKEDTASMLMGRSVHCATLEPDRFPLDYVVFGGERRQGKVWDAFKEANADKSILRADEYATCLAIRDSVRANPVARHYLDRGRAEFSIVWTDPETGLKCKGRVDWVSESLPGFCDLKTTRSVAVREFAGTVARMLYHGQMAFYQQGLRANGIDVPPMFLAVEQAPPHDCVVYELDDDALWAGEELVRRLLRRVAECEAKGEWPGRYEGTQTLTLPAWAFPDVPVADVLDRMGMTYATAEED